MKIKKSTIFLAIFVSLSAIQALATEAVMKNISYDDCTVARHLNSSFAEFFEGNANIFEGTVTATGPVPNRPNPGLNECWVTLHVDKWHKTSLATNEVNVLIHTDPTEGMSANSKGVYCPIKPGDALLIFGGDYVTDTGTGNANFYVGECSLYLPKVEARFFIRMLNSWNNNRK